ncbi:FKBP-type peptidyl-prolyl cis-trans isomerase [Sphingosinicella sp. CPCC 101087]|uniref:FKBP-type peptidyl-prolyl cis-trans isomerase n=1 Tax=Sphingosinicella sp. CPCC 101087 TaxID=2497754 RepID=UPI00101E20E2|nr:FKBP-type peptidyl-prolyl cis-trans isomerase [Sphingosinicella sp. CPCC 101087]
MKPLFALALLLIPAAASAQAPGTNDAAWHNAQSLALWNLKPEEGWRTTASGMRYRQVAQGQPGGRRPAATDTVTIHYVGTLVDGTEFDSSVARGEPATFPLPRLIRGWQEGVPLMAVADRFEFAIPQHLAYGPLGRGPIPGGATLFFTIELIEIVDPPVR